ncbi:MAG: prepilin-type N-terminal cleavage/methylation domain-containing protein [Magnetococcales bacterium]|nr:prepilin-type N-terminal cleavage/methylation domain-containing protein [Magnetococcales bacterium]
MSPAHDVPKRVNSSLVHGEERGFTMIELVIVIVVIGILASMAIPRLGGNINREAANANAQAIAGAMGAAAANYNAKSALGISAGTTLTCAAALSLVGGIVYTNYSLGGNASGGCTVRHIEGNTSYTTVRVTP